MIDPVTDPADHPADHSAELPVDAPLVEVLRGTIVEARHRGVIVVKTPDGETLTSLGDGALLSSTRSTIKAIQALPCVLSGAVDHFALSPRELALVCASHTAEPRHTEGVSALLARAGLREDDLRCGPHAPIDVEAARALVREGQEPRPVHNNCSGKHTGMLLTCRRRGWPIDDYIALTHPLQREIRGLLARLVGLPGPEAITRLGVDGCSAPTFGVAIDGLARAAATLANPDALADAPLAAAIRRITAAMAAHPEMVGGTCRLDTAVMRAAEGALVCKIGAESVYSIAVFPCARYPAGLGVALKIADGGARALRVVVIETLRQLGVLDAPALARLRRFDGVRERNCRGLEIGVNRPVFTLPGR
ncbi:MAG: asparaginase [Myxococcales bacterium]|nr:asparaginase [Myxococcales bacterium]